MRGIVVGLIGALGISVGVVWAEEPATVPTPPHRPKVVLVLSGGGARGSAHIGVIKVLEQYHVPVDLIVGTSMGSIVGGLYASGWSSGEMETKITTLDWGSVFMDKLPRAEKSYRRKEEEDRFLIPIKMRFKNWKPYLPPSVIGGQNLELLFQGFAIEATGESNFDLFPIPYRAVASDLATGKAVILGSGSLSTCMRASMSLPGIFPPVEIDGVPLADGGMAANFPIRIARALGADVVIGVDITTPLKKKEQLGNLLTRIDQVTGLLTNANKEADMAAVEPQDIILVPDLSDITFSDFAKAGETIVRGEVAARDAEARLRALAVPDAEWEAYVARHHRRSEASLVVDEVVIENTGPLSDAIVDRRLVVPIGEPLVEAKLAEQITQLYGLEVFGPIHHELERKADKGVLTIQVPSKPYGRNSLQFGFFLASDLEGDLSFDLTLSHLFLPINRMGGEWRNIVQLGTNSVLGTEYYQPLDPSLQWVFDTKIQFRRDLYDFFTSNGDAVAQYTFDTLGGDVGFGRIFGNWGQVGIGAFRTTGSGNPRIGPPVFPGVDSDDGGFVVQFFVRDFDSVTWPRNGWRVDSVYRRSFTFMGAQASGDYFHVEVGKATSIGKNVVSMTAEANNVCSGPTLIDNVAVLGGFLRLSGLQPNQLLGSKGGLARFMYYRELTSFDLGSLTQRMFAGFSAETGNVYVSGDPVTVKSLRVAGSIFVGADTFLGPAYLGYGYEQSGQEAGYLIIGQRF